MTAAKRALSLFLDRVSGVAREIKFYHASSVRRRGEAARGICKTKQNHDGNHVVSLGIVMIIRGILFYVERNLSGLNPKKWELRGCQVRI